MSKTLSLRGTFSFDDNAMSADNEIFLYEANDLTRGWVVEAAYLWPVSIRAGHGNVNGQMMVAASIATDTITPADPTDLDFDQICNASDNRQIGFLNSGYQMRSGGGDFIANSGNPAGPVPFVIDAEHIVANGLWINAYSTTDSSTSPARDWNYMVVLRPKRLDPKETILHLIKNVAQDFTS